MDLSQFEISTKNLSVDFNLFHQLAELTYQKSNIEPWLIDFSSFPQTIYSSDKLNTILGIKSSKAEFQNYFSEVIQNFSSKMSADKVNDIIDAFNGAIDGRYSTYDVIYDFFDHEGKRRWINAVALRIERDDSGRAIRMLGTHRDVTDIYQQKEHVTNVIDSCCDAVFTTDLITISESNHAFKETFPSAIFAADIFNKIKYLTLDGQAPKAIDADFIKLNLQKPVQVQIIENNIRSSFSLFIEKQGVNANEYSVRLTKVTDQINNSHDLKKAQSIYQHSSEGIIFTDLNCNVISVNNAFTEITGYKPEDIIGKNPSVMSSGRQYDNFYQDMWRAINDKGIWKGEICNRHKNGDCYYEILTITAIYNELGILSNYVGMFSDITVQKRQQEELEYLAHHDHLTSLANRALLSKCLNKAIHSKQSFGVLYLDLDGFKKINDSYGHAAGDHLLVELSKKFKNVVRKHDTVARIGGDEFVILMDDISESSDCLFVVERLLVQAASVVYFKNIPLQVTASLGATFYYSDEKTPTDLDTLLKQADCAMYYAKRSGKNCFKIYNENMIQNAHAETPYLEKSNSASSVKDYSHIESNKRNVIRKNILEYLVKNLPLNNILLKIIEGVELDYPGMKCSVLQVDESGKYLVDGIAPSLPSFYNDALDGIRIALNVGSCGHAAASKKRMIVEDIQTHPNWKRVKNLAKRAGLAACWSEPIIGAGGKVLGTFAIYHTEKTIPAQDDFKLIDMSAQLAALAIEKDLANKALWVSLNYDSLTKLPNKNLFIEKVKTALSVPKNKFALLHLDIKQFHLINHSFGHEFGDKVLIHIANMLRNIVAKQDDIARVNGDEFVILTNGDINVLNAFSSKVAQKIREPIAIEDKHLHLNVCIGISIYPDDAINEKEIFSNASKALRAHKASPISDYHHFDQTLQFVANERMALENDLYKAIERDEFFLAYQPIFDLQTDKLVKAEALIRWNHPTRGILAPDLFIPIAEETKLIVEIGQIVFVKAMEVLSKWRTEYDPEFKISINTSVVQYQAKSLLVDTWLKKYDVIKGKNHGLIVELTESVLLDDHENIAYQLEMLKQAGFEIALDDFGTGYSSLSYLQKFQFDYLKIDRSFVEEINLENENNALCKTIVLMGQNLGIKVIAEGVESKVHSDVLKHMKAEYAQGYYFSRPVPEHEFVKFFN